MCILGIYHMERNEIPIWKEARMMLFLEIIWLCDTGVPVAWVNIYNVQLIAEAWKWHYLLSDPAHTLSGHSTTSVWWEDRCSTMDLVNAITANITFNTSLLQVTPWLRAAWELEMLIALASNKMAKILNLLQMCLFILLVMIR